MALELVETNPQAKELTMSFFSLKVVLLTLEILDFVNKVEKCYYNVPRNFGVNMNLAIVEILAKM